MIPIEIQDYFSDSDLSAYPFLSIPNCHIDSRGYITNIADGLLGDVALISSKRGAIRANHYHKTDWHLTYLIKGRFVYEWLNDGEESTNEVEVKPGEMIFTPAMCRHTMRFTKNSLMLAVARNSRTQDAYEADTIRF